MGWAMFGNVTAIFYKKLVISIGGKGHTTTNYVKRELVPQAADTTNLLHNVRGIRGNSLQTLPSRERVLQNAEAAHLRLTVR